MRKWFVRSVVFGIVGVCIAALVLYYRWTNPAAVRQEVLVELQKHFPGALINLESARLRLLGGIQVQKLRLTRKDNGKKLEFLHIPCVIYHDKGKAARGAARHPQSRTLPPATARPSARGRHLKSRRHHRTLAAAHSDSHHRHPSRHDPARRSLEGWKHRAVRNHRCASRGHQRPDANGDH